MNKINASHMRVHAVWRELTKRNRSIDAAKVFCVLLRTAQTEFINEADARLLLELESDLCKTISSTSTTHREKQSHAALTLVRATV